MNKNFDPRLLASSLFRLAIGLALSLIAIYSLIYYYEPFSPFGNDLASNAFTVFAAALSAMAATMVWLFYERTDAPRKVWNRLSIGLWLWAGAELVWAFYNMRDGEVNLGIPDLLWVLTYAFMMASLYQQYMILAEPSPQEKHTRKIWMGAWFILLAVILILILVNFIYQSEFIAAAVNTFYPLGDLFIALLALGLAYKFRGGTFARPWYGLLLFTVADLMYAWLDISGAYSWSVENKNPLSAVTDILYFSAYLAVATGILGHWLVIRYRFLRHKVSG